MHQRTKIAVAVAMALNSMAVFAQATPEPTLQRVEVTGSRIRTVDLATAQPVLVMTQEQIQKSGLVTVGDILNTMSSAGSPAFSKGAVLTSNREQGGQYIDMRHLGAQRVLVLVNGKRWTQTVGGYTDMSTIPSAMIERVEVLKDGASAVYGSDAIAGVVNIILKKRMEGGQFSGYIGENQGGDAKTSDFSVTYGTGSDKASMMFGLSHAKQGVIYARDRALTSYTYGPTHQTDNLGTGAFGRIRQVSATGTATGFNKYLNHTGEYDAPGIGQDPRVPANYHDFLNGGLPADKYNSTRDMMFNSPTELSTMFTKGTVELPMDMRFVTTAMYSHRASTATVAGYPASSLMQVSNPVYIDKDSYYNPYGNQVAGAGLGQDLFWYRRTIEVPRATVNKNDTIHVDAAIEGVLNLGSNPWNWSVGVNHSKTSGRTENSGNLNLINLKKALGPSFLNAGGVVQCGTAAKPIALLDCTPFNILGGPNASTAGALNYVMAQSQAQYGSTINSITADATGDIFKLPAGGLGLAIGFEKRTVSGYDRPNVLDQLNLTSSLAGKATVGKYDVKEAYVEATIPLLKSKPFAELLSINLASRTSDYSNFGKTTNSKGSFMWKPMKDLLARGTIAQGFRAPTLGDTFGGGSQSFDSYLDPCDTVNGGARTVPEAAARCAAVVPAGFRQRGQTGAPVPATGAQTPTPFNAGAGNGTLSPETAITKTLGFVYNPSFVPGLSLALDWFDITVKDRITAVSAGYILGQCYIQNVPSFCTLFKRDATGQISELNRGNANLGEVITAGYDLGVAYKFKKTAFGQFGVKTETTYMDKYTIQSNATAAPVSYAGEYPLYRVKSNVTVEWNMGNFSATFGSRIRSHAKSTCWEIGDPANNVAPEECSNPTGDWSAGTGFDRKPTSIYNDISVGYQTPWKGKIMVGINNVFDKKPRLNYDADASAASVDPDVPLERFMFVRYNQSF
ncbi:MAG: TonB-dependent receptor [Pseudomonadota bacterium]